MYALITVYQRVVEGLVWPHQPSQPWYPVYLPTVLRTAYVSALMRLITIDGRSLARVMQHTPLIHGWRVRLKGVGGVVVGRGGGGAQVG